MIRAFKAVDRFIADAEPTLFRALGTFAWVVALGDFGGAFNTSAGPTFYMAMAASCWARTALLNSHR